MIDTSKAYILFCYAAIPFCTWIVPVCVQHVSVLNASLYVCLLVCGRASLVWKPECIWGSKKERRIDFSHPSLRPFGLVHTLSLSRAHVLSVIRSAYQLSRRLVLDGPDCESPNIITVNKYIGQGQVNHYRLHKEGDRSAIVMGPNLRL